MSFFGSMEEELAGDKIDQFLIEAHNAWQEHD